jgi:hypothetical protein
MKTQGSLADLIEAKAALNGLPWFLEGGTLLGAVRDGALIPWRSCLGIGALDCAEEASKCFGQLGYVITPYKWLYTACRHGAYFDIMRYDRKTIGCEDVVCALGSRFENKVKTFTCAELPMSFFKNMATVQIDGVEFPAPANPEEFLRLQYGDWRTPRKYHNSHPCFYEYYKGDVLEL